jgi:DNA-binding transcriptional LysR family regulator
MNITFRQLKLFLALAETGSVSAAARAMHVTQPTASMQLKEVTQSVGIPLFEVISKKVHLTDMGLELAQTARAIVQTWEAFEQGVDGVKGLARGKLRVAVVSTAKYFIPRLIGSFCKKYPEIDVSLEILNRDGVVQRMRDNLDDLYIMSQPPNDLDLSDEIFMANPLVLIAASRSMLVKQGGVELKSLGDQRFILREQGSGTRMGVDQYFKKNKFRPDIRMELGSNEAIKEAVAGGLGIGIVSRHSLHGQQKEHGVAVVDLLGFPILSNWHIVHPASKKLSPIATEFKLHMRKELKRHL